MILTNDDSEFLFAVLHVIRAKCAGELHSQLPQGDVLRSHKRGFPEIQGTTRWKNHPLPHWWESNTYLTLIIWAQRVRHFLVVILNVPCLFCTSAASGVAQPLEKLSDTVTTSFDGSPPLWVTRVQKAGSTKKEVFVNNARIHEKRSNFQGVNGQNSAQVSTNDALWLSQLFIEISQFKFFFKWRAGLKDNLIIYQWTPIETFFYLKIKIMIMYFAIKNQITEIK